MDIRQLIPQREPMLMVDAMVEASANEALTTFEVRADNLFLDEDGRLAECAIIENQAQSASALAGKRALDGGAQKVPTGYIGEVKRFNCLLRPQVGQKLLTTVHWGMEVGQITIVQVETTVDGQLAASTQLKVYLSKD